MTTTLLAYSKEISPRIRDIAKRAELQKDFKDSDAGYLKLVEEMEEIKDKMKVYLEASDDYKEITGEKKELEKELKLALKAASENTNYKPAELGAFFKARNREEGVVKVVVRGELFAELDGVLA